MSGSLAGKVQWANNINEGAGYPISTLHRYCIMPVNKDTGMQSERNGEGSGHLWLRVLQSTMYFRHVISEKFPDFKLRKMRTVKRAYG
jgi:hypothetical protein